MADDRGVTLVELIVVILITGILAGSAVVGYQSLDSGNAKASVSRISALLDYVKAENMSMDKDYYLIIEKQEDFFVAKVQSEDLNGEIADLLNEKLKLKGGQIAFYGQDSAIRYIVDDATTPAVSLKLGYYRSSGAFRPSDVDGDGTEDGDIKRIEITSSGRSFSIYLVTKTGKHYIK